MRFLVFLIALANAAFALEPIKIGVILPLTGNNAYVGERFQKAVQMSYDELPAAKRSRYQLVFEDDQGLLKMDLLAARRLTELEKVDVLVSFAPGAFKVIAPIATQKDIIQLGVSLSHELADAKNNFTFWGRPSDCAELVIQRLQAENRKKIALLYVHNDPGVRQTEAFQNAAEKAGLTIAAKEHFPPGERDFRANLLKITASQPDVIFLFGWMPEIDILLRQMKQLDMKTPVTTIESFNFLENRSLIEGVWYATSANPTSEFQARFQKRYQLPGDWFESSFYDSIQLIYEACEKYPDGKPTRQEIAGALLTIKDRPSASGILTMNPQGQMIIPSHIVKMTDGQAVRQK